MSDSNNSPSPLRQRMIDDMVMRKLSISLTLNENVTIVHCGGHFAGSSTLLWRAGASGKGALLTGDSIYVVPDRRYVSFMYSFPNHVPLRPSELLRVKERLEPHNFDRIYPAKTGSVLSSGGKAAIERSIARYIAVMVEE